ncbi:MAG TPA: condensation domain-containing protein, partial [Actinomycetota bacterium]|nr:condensation domain-containing protein [Actinomycetota bacterium]
RAAAERLDPAAGVMTQLVWFDAGPGRPGKLLWLVHHLVVDGVSWRILLPDLAQAYEGAELEPVPVPFREWALASAAAAVSAARAGELPDWLALLGGSEPALGARALDPDRDLVSRMRRYDVTVPAEVTEALLTRVPAAFHAGVDDVLLAAFAAAVTEWRRHGGGVLVDIEGHGREPLRDGMDLSRTVGWFTSVYPVRLDPGPADLAEVRAGGPAAGRLVKRIKEQLRAGPSDGLGYGLLRYLNPETGGVLAALPSPQIGFGYLGRFAAAGPGEARPWQPIGRLDGGTGATTPARYVLEAAAMVLDLPAGPVLTLTLSWPGELLAAGAVEALAAGWAATLTGLFRHVASGDSGGHTPSDFPLTDIAQYELDEFEATAKKIARKGAT